MKNDLYLYEEDDLKEDELDLDGDTDVSSLIDDTDDDEKEEII